MEIRCPYCEKTVQVPGGGQFTCPSCRAVFAVDLEPQAPRPPESTVPAASPGPGPAGPPPLPTGPRPPIGGPAPSMRGPVCARHPTTDAAEVCKRCGNFMCGTCATVFKDGQRYCPDCVGILSGGSGYGAPSNIAWEAERATIGTASAWWKTAKACMFSPDSFFRDMSSAGGLEQPLGFNVLGTTVFGLISQLIALAIMAAVATAVAGSRGGAQIATQLPGTVCSMVMLPVLAAVGLFIGSAIYHVIALICGANGTFETTFRILGYSAGSTQVLNVVPYLGAFVASFWNMVLVYYGCLHQHRMSSGRALMVVLIPFFLGVCCVIGLLVAFGGMIMAAIGANGGGGF